MAFFFNYCINTPWKRLACLQNKCFRHFIPFYSNSKQTNIWMRRCICFVFENTSHSVIKGVKVSIWWRPWRNLNSFGFLFVGGYCGVKNIIDSLLFLFLLLDIGLINRANHENLDLSVFFFLNWTKQTKNVLKIIPCFVSATSIYICIYIQVTLFQQIVLFIALFDYFI